MFKFVHIYLHGVCIATSLSFSGISYTILGVNCVRFSLTYTMQGTLKITNNIFRFSPIGYCDLRYL
jgi:hypothetical protein